MSSTLDIIVMVGQLILALSILVGVHEAGHLLAAKLFGMRVEQRYVDLNMAKLVIQSAQFRSADLLKYQV